MYKEPLILFKERLNRILTASALKEPDIVPIVANIETWAISYAGKKSMDVLGNPQAEFECFSKVFSDFYFDGTLIGFLTRDVNMHKSLGGGSCFYSSDGVSIQNKPYNFMKEDEYPLLIKDPLGYAVNTDFKRKYPSLSKPYPENYNSLKESLDVFINFIKKASMSGNYYKETIGMPLLPSSTGVMPVDLIMDYLRGMEGIMIDIRRRPEQVKEAAEALVDLIINDITKGAPKLEPFPFIFFPMHIPTYLRAKQFEDIYWPTFIKILCRLNEMGGKAILVLEGNWEHLYDFVKQIPKDFAIAVLDQEDVFKAKKEIGKNIAIMGGIPTAMLRYETKEKCLDYAKRLVDECAPGGGFIATTDKLLLAPGDVNEDNFRAVNEFIHNYGKY